MLKTSCLFEILCCLFDLCCQIWFLCRMVSPKVHNRSMNYLWKKNNFKINLNKPKYYLKFFTWIIFNQVVQRVKYALWINVKTRLAFFEYLVMFDHFYFVVVVQNWQNIFILFVKDDDYLMKFNWVKWINSLPSWSDLWTRKVPVICWP